MIVDGVEVLYAMRNGKIVDPNIPMDGLVCYLDTRGKYNTDVYRNTLLDLSGNGNHGTLQNFNFTDGSGYENSGLKFDGVDDLLSTVYTLTEGTLFLKFKINPLNTSHSGMYMTCLKRFSLYSTRTSHAHYVDIIADETTYHTVRLDAQTDLTVVLRAGSGKFKVQINDFVREVDLSNPTLPPAIIGNSQRLDRGSDIIVNKFMAYDRPLTDEEITQLMEV